ncbi:TolC family protein [Flavihumibacter petaseus]|uniref:Putative efflux pump outer membrane protein n=1 Tax=Flavihumibacter petaseus NBRC 106054 TaxID=1220578 RepID=A0A0E9N5N8_9BACT|nr:TolC family protein [Flavihumibacter petaseus]GAO45134.1 putative efflux pump outer membrane protein [Flavihumibacter petaseus NBRC 106054]
MTFLSKCSLLLLTGKLIVLGVLAQDTKVVPAGTEEWDLRRCVDYAVQNNISVRQSDVQKRIADLMYEQSRQAKIPNANFSLNNGLKFGRSIDPTTNLYTNQQLLYQGFQFNTDVTIFNWNRINHNITANRLEAAASAADVEKNKNDIALNVATAYLTALLSKVQVDIVRVQLKQSQDQLADTRKRVNAGTLPELNAVDLEAQVARDSANVISSDATFQLNLLSLKALLNLDAAQPFSIAVPPVEFIPVDPIAELQPALVYDLALKNQPAQKANDLRKQSLEASIKTARANLYPSIFAAGGLSSNFASTDKKFTGEYQFRGIDTTLNFVGILDANGKPYNVLSPNYLPLQAKKSFGELWQGYGDQLSNNFSQNIAVGISVPINNGFQARTNYKRSKLNLENQKLVIEQANQTLKQDIYSAYTNAVASLQKYNASKASMSAAQRSYDFASRRYELGLLSTLELITSQSNLTRAKIDVANAQFDYVFRMKVLEFYKGMGIKL